MGDRRGAYRVLVGRPEGKRLLGRPNRSWECNVDMKWGGGMEWIEVAQDRHKWRAVANAVMNLWVRRIQIQIEP